jgi:hypothetical protein
MMKEGNDKKNDRTKMGKITSRERENRSVPQFTHNPVAKSITHIDKVGYHCRKAHSPAKTLINTTPSTDMKEMMGNPTM